MKKLKLLIALITMLFFVNNNTWGQYNLSNILSTTLDYYAGSYLTITNDYGGAVTIDGVTVGSSKSISLNTPGQRTVGGVATGHFFMRCVQNPAEITVTDNGDGTMTIAGIDPFFVNGPGGNRLFNSSNSIVGQGQSSYTVPRGTYTLVCADGINAGNSIPISPPPVTTIAVTGVSVNPTSLSGQVGGSGALTATVSPANATNKSVTWSSSNPSVATVANGTVNYLGAGTCTITATTDDGGYQASCSVTVTVPTYTVTVSSAGTGATGGGSYVAGATVSISAGTPPAGQQFKNWTTTSAGVTFADANSSSTSFTMPANAVTVTANFEAIPIVNAQTPTITSQPQSATVNVGDAVSLSVAASVTDGGTLTYQWY